MDHRGARGAEPNTGDGAGMLTALPHEFLAKVAKQEFGVDAAAAGQVRRRHRVPADRRGRARALQGGRRASCAPRKARRSSAGASCRRRRDAADVGESARARRCRTSSSSFVAAGDGFEGDAFERKLYLIRKRASHRLRGDKTLRQAEAVLRLQPLEQRSLIYKGMLTPGQLLELLSGSATTRTTRRTSRWCIRGSRRTRSRAGTARSRTGSCRTTARSTRCAATRTGCARARASSRSELFGDSLQKLFPIVEPDCSGLRRVRQRARVPADDGPHAPGIRDDDDSGGVAEERADAREQAGVLRVSTRASWSRGTVPRRSRSPTASTSAPCSIATACARAAIT